MKRIASAIADPALHLAALAVVLWYSLEAAAGLIDLIIGPLADAIFGP